MDDFALPLTPAVDRLLATMRQTKPEHEMKGKLQKWLQQEGFTVDDLPQDRTTFFLVAHKGGQSPLFLFNPADSIERLVVRLDMRIADADRTRLLRSPNREQCLWDIIQSLNALNLETQIDDPTPGKIMMRSTIYRDGLTKDRLFQAITALNNGERVVNACFLRALGQLLASPTGPLN